MAWFLNGNWDCLTTPPGASVNDLPLIMEQIARAINERSIALGGAGTQWKYTDALDVSTTFPTAAQFAGIRVNGPCVRQFLQLAESWQETGDGWYTSATFATEYDSTSWAALFSDLGPFDITKSATYAPNWLRLKRAISAKRFTTISPDLTGGDSDIQQQMEQERYVFSLGDEGATPEEAWDNALAGTFQTGLIGVDNHYICKQIVADSGDFIVYNFNKQHQPLIYKTSNYPSVLFIGMRLYVYAPLDILIVQGNSASPIGGTAQVKVNGNLISGWTTETVGLIKQSTANHIETASTYTIDLSFSDGDEAFPGLDASYVSQKTSSGGGPLHDFLVDLQPALTIA